MIDEELASAFKQVRESYLPVRTVEFEIPVLFADLIPPPLPFQNPCAAEACADLFRRANGAGCPQNTPDVADVAL